MWVWVSLVYRGAPFVAEDHFLFSLLVLKGLDVTGPIFPFFPHFGLQNGAERSGQELDELVGLASVKADGGEGGEEGCHVRQQKLVF